MANAISDVSLKEIYSLSTEDKLDLINLIIKSIKSAVSFVKPKDSVAQSSWVDQFDGMWSDHRSADEMVADIRSARTSNSDVEL